MSHEALFKVIFLCYFFGLIGIRVYYQRRSGSYALGVAKHAEKHLENEVPALRILRPLFGLPFYAALLGWLFSANWVRHVELPVPLWMRWSGAAVGAFGILLAWFAHQALGVNFRATLGLREGHKLVTGGPYRWVQHPLYDSFLLLMVSAMLLSANWLMGATGIPLLLSVMGYRAREEERELSNAFGAPYVAYQQRTGRFLPFKLFGKV